MGNIWKPREETFSTVQYDITGDREWLRSIKPRIFELKGFVPFMISNAGELICIPGFDADAASIIISGAKRTGKSILVSSLLNSYYYSVGNLCLHANDSNRETFSWHRRSQARIAETFWDFRRPKYLPLIHILLQSKNLRLYEKRVPHWDACLPFLDVLEDPEEYLGFEKAASANYFANMRDRFVKEKVKKLDWPGVKDIILDELERSDTEAKVVKSIYNSIIARVARLVKDGILDISGLNPRADTMVKLRFTKDSPWMEFNVLSGLLAAGGIPVLHTDNIKSNHRFFKTYLSNQLQKVRDDMVSHSFFKDKKLMIFVDELQAICHNKRGGENSVIEELVTGGGPIGIGTVYALQNPSKLPEGILSNAKYFITCQNSRTEAKLLCSEFSVEDRYVDRIIHLNKRYKGCIAYTNERFAVFNPAENEFSYSSGPFEGEYIHSASRTLPPRSESGFI